MFKFTIDRSKWAVPSNLEKRGEDSRMETESGLMCCLGALARVCHPTMGMKDAMTPAELKGCKLPSAVQPGREENTWGVIQCLNTKLAERLIHTNDEPDITNKQRERDIRKLMAEGGIKISTGKYL